MWEVNKCSTPSRVTGDEHWTKVLQANEVNANVTLLLGDGGHLPCWSRARALLTADTHRHSVDPGLIASVYQRVCRWFAATRRHLHRDFRRTARCVSSDEHRQAALTGGASSPRCPPSGAPFKFQLTSASSDDSGVDTSTCSSLTSAGPASTTSGDPCRPCGDNGARVDGACANAATNIRTDACCMRSHLTTTLSCPSNRKVSAQSMAAGRDKETLCATWPPTGKSTSVYDDEGNYGMYTDAEHVSVT
ncbi:hypothetical protein NP493_1626g00036 [Ridgeia piscesae]|uniref:Uncharacterized protein n=1 Tax=Ridgeia piscesae TaxID=27915 RepID=A0AAD9JXQ9_RIDPI|nr:hypothetical protein NP493_1626g00036 [Ridgeia piscesae]